MAWHLGAARRGNVISVDSSILLDEAGRTLVVGGLIMVVLLVPMAIIGLIISIIQAATSISEQTLSFVPKLLGLLGSGLVDQSQKMTVAARATAEKKAFGHRS